MIGCQKAHGLIRSPVPSSTSGLFRRHRAHPTSGGWSPSRIRPGARMVSSPRRACPAGTYIGLFTDCGANTNGAPKQNSDTIFLGNTLQRGHGHPVHRHERRHQTLGTFSIPLGGTASGTVTDSTVDAPSWPALRGRARPRGITTQHHVPGPARSSAGPTPVAPTASAAWPTTGVKRVFPPKNRTWRTRAAIQLRLLRPVRSQEWSPRPSTGRCPASAAGRRGEPRAMTRLTRRARSTRASSQVAGQARHDHDGEDDHRQCPKSPAGEAARRSPAAPRGRETLGELPEPDDTSGSEPSVLQAAPARPANWRQTLTGSPLRTPALALCPRRPHTDSLAPGCTAAPPWGGGRSDDERAPVPVGPGPRTMPLHGEDELLGLAVSDAAEATVMPWASIVR